MQSSRMRFTVRLLMASVILMTLARGDDQVPVQDRDREVLEIVLTDVMDPKNPEYKGLEPGQLKCRGIVLHRMTELEDDFFLGPALKEIEEGGRLSKEVGKEWSRRNAGPQVPTKAFRFLNHDIIIDDIEAILEKSGGDFAFAEAFWKKHPGTWGWVYPTLPGFSRDGKSAVVLMSDGPSFHGSVWMYKLVQFQDRWKVVWRRHKRWE